MTASFCIIPLSVHHIEMDGLRTEAAGDGFQFVERLVSEWQSGANKFDQPGEALLAAQSEGDVVGLCGLNRDPYSQLSRVGRIRHLYVRKSFRRLGVGTALVNQLLGLAVANFDVVRLRTDTQSAARFYLSLGFAAVQNETASHVMHLR
jgi:GNAT superfamily N-acetyltransferase